MSLRLMVTANPHDPYTTRPVSGGFSKDVKFFELTPSREGSRKAKAIAAAAIFRTLRYTGMRRGEALSLRWENVNLNKRIIKLGATQTKERRPKRVPIHKDLRPILLAINSKRKRPTPSDPVFLTPGGSRPHEDSLKKPWGEALESLELKPEPRIHDLRHCWKTNAMRSRLDKDIRDIIVGHGNKKRTPQTSIFR